MSEDGTEDPLVPIVADRVAAALRYREMSVNALAGAAGEHPQTLDAIVSGATQRCRRSRRGRIARELACPADWLGGEAELRGIVPWSGGPQEGQPIQYDEMGFVHRMSPEGRPLGLSGAAYQLACWDVSEQVIDAWKRDIALGVPGAIEAKEEVERDSFGEWERVRRAVQRLLSCHRWRSHLLVPRELGRPMNREDWKRRRQDADEFAIQQSKAVLHALQPWLSGERSIDYRVLADAVWTQVRSHLSDDAEEAPSKKNSDTGE